MNKQRNSDIEIFLKTQQYKTGTIDITELNRALRDKNTILKTKLTLKQSIVDKEISLQKLSDIPLEKIQLPTFTPLSQDEYEKHNFNIRLSQLDIAQTGENYNIIKSNYYPVFSLNAAYGYMNNPNLNRSGDYNSVGVLLSIPLDFNTKSTIEESRVTLLRKKLEIQETKRDEDALYKQGVSKIKNYKEHNKVVKNNIALYTKLIDITKEGVRLGMKTGYDLQTLENTKKIDEIELKLNETNIQIELATLRFATTLGERYYGR